MHHWLLVLYTGLDKTRVARTYRFSTIKQIAHAVGSTTTVVSNTVHRLILPRDNLRYCTIRKDGRVLALAACSAHTCRARAAHAAG
jgi:hypothetical protein